MSDLGRALQDFLLALSALFSIVNPPGSALIFSQVTADRFHADRLVLARKVGVYAGVVMLVSLWGGAYVLSFFGITLAALRIAGGLVVGANAWALLTRAEEHEERKEAQASHATEKPDVAFFPLTMPFTTGPGTISVAVALGSNLPSGSRAALLYVLDASAAAVAVALGVWLAYASADRLVDRLGQARARVLNRISAFLLLCIATQIALNGVTEALHDALRP